MPRSKKAFTEDQPSTTACKNEAMEVERGTFKVSNLKGLHARPCAELVRCASRFRSQVYLEFGSKRVEAKSLLGLLTLAAEYGASVVVVAQGVDAKQAVNAILQLASEQFGIDY